MAGKEAISFWRIGVNHIAQQLREMADQIEQSASRLDIKPDITLSEAIQELELALRPDTFITVGLDFISSTNSRGTRTRSYGFKVYDGKTSHQGTCLGALVATAKAAALSKNGDGVEVINSVVDAAAAIPDKAMAEVAF